MSGCGAGAFLWLVAWPMARRWFWHWIAPGAVEVMGGVAVVAVSAAIARWLPAEEESPVPGRPWWPLWAALGSLAGVLVFNLRFPQAQGRFLFPSLACHGILAGYGLRVWVRTRRVVRGVVAGLAAVNVVILVSYVYRTFQGSW